MQKATAWNRRAKLGSNRVAGSTKNNGLCCGGCRKHKHKHNSRVIDGRIAVKGKNDLDKLICGELFYTGSLRTNVAAIVQSIPVHDDIAGVASELFALSADVHLVLGNITEKQYTCETADGRGKSMPEAFSRLARVVCADTEMLCTQEILNIAKHIYEKQI